MSRLINADDIKFEMLTVEKDTPSVKYRKKTTVAFKKDIDAMPTVDAVQVIRCKDCKHFELNHFENVNGIPLIVAHEICTKCGDGCKTSSDGYCFLAERKEK